jgi:hypothetical protein
MPTHRLPDPYATLGVSRGATSSELRAAYRQLAVLSAAILSAGILPFPLLSFLVLVFAGRLFGRDG